MNSDQDVATFQRRLTISWIVMLVLAVVLLVPHVRRWMSAGITGEQRPVTPRGELADFEKTSIEVFRKASPSVVYINTRQRRQANPWSFRQVEVEAGTGSGFVWDQQGHIVTNLHVIRGASSAQVVFTDQTGFDATLVGASEDHDLAVLKISADPDQLSPVLIGESDNLEVGQSVFAIGNPFRLGQTYTTGVISALSQNIRSQGANGRTIDDVIQIDAAINPGNSGGPLLDSAGRLIGVNSAIYSPSGASAGIGFAIPVETVNRVVPEIIANGRYEPPQIGIKSHPILNRLVADRLGVQGIVVQEVSPDSPAATIGLRAARESQGNIVLGDIIMKVDDLRVTSLNELRSALEHHQAGDTVTLTILREGEEQTVELTLQ